MTNILLIILIVFLIYKELPKKKQEARTEATAQKNIEAEKLTEEFENIMSYKIDDAINAYSNKRGDD